MITSSTSPKSDSQSIALSSPAMLMLEWRIHCDLRGDRHAKPDGGGDNLFALPEIFFKLQRVSVLP